MKKIIVQEMLTVDGFFLVILGTGKTVFASITKRCNLKHVETKEFKSGNVLLKYTRL